MDLRDLLEKKMIKLVHILQGKLQVRVKDLKEYAIYLPKKFLITFKVDAVAIIL